MTKTLTEQWKDMDLADEHLYYWRMPNGEVRIMTKMGVYSYKLCYNVGKIDILAPVPSYDEWKKLDDELKELATKNDTLAIENGRLKEQLAIATKALEELELKSDKFYRGGNDWSLVEQLDFIKAKCQETLYHLEEMEGVK